MRNPRGTRFNGRFGIMNHVGSIWSPETFDTESEASAYLARQQKENPSWDLRRHAVVPVRVTVSPLKGEAA